MRATAILILIIAVFIILNGNNLQKVINHQANFAFNAKPSGGPLKVTPGHSRGKD